MATREIHGSRARLEEVRLGSVEPRVRRDPRKAHAIPSEEVAEFCDNGALDKTGTLCAKAYRTRNVRLGAGR